jgi:hypothetical protein
MSRRRALWLLGLASVVLLGILAVLDMRMQDTGGPGIVAFELAGSSERADEILGQWGEDGRAAARQSLWLDFPYLLAYSAFLSLAVMAIRDAGRRNRWRRFAGPGTVIAALPWAAGAFDAVEDVNLLLVLGGHGGDAAPVLATGFAIAKFIGLAVVGAYLLCGLAALAAKRLSLSRRSG